MQSFVGHTTTVCSACGRVIDPKEPRDKLIRFDHGGRVQFLLDGKVPLGKDGKPQSSRQENLQVTFWAGKR